MTRKRGSNRPVPPKVKVAVVSPEPSFLLVRADYPRLPPATVFALWTRPELLTRWWPPRAELDLRVGGKYCFSWPEQGWELEGEILTLSPPEEIGFSWRWRHEPSHVSVVKVTIEPAVGGGSVVLVRHGPYVDSPEGVEQRRGHLEGWEHLLTRLAAANAGG
jgi:uncharacterized protein YndB with AHSA1/START domain